LAFGRFCLPAGAGFANRFPRIHGDRAEESGFVFRRALPPGPEYDSFYRVRIYFPVTKMFLDKKRRASYNKIRSSVIPAEGAAARPVLYGFDPG
jgi:hypothetical protein